MAKVIVQTILTLQSFHMYNKIYHKEVPIVFFLNELMNWIEWFSAILLRSLRASLNTNVTFFPMALRGICRSNNILGVATNLKTC